MSLSNATWQEFARSANVQETWSLWLFYDGGSSEIRLSDRDFKQGSNVYHGLVRDWGSIRRSINLSKSTAKTSNVTVTLKNGLFHGLPLSDEIKPGATRKYINREVRIYSMLNGQIAGMQIYSGRLRNVEWDDEEVRLDIEPQSPWDFLSLPTLKTASGRYFPAVYGDFTASTSAPGSEAYCPNTGKWPCPVDTWSRTELQCLSFGTIASGGQPHIYEESADSFVPVLTYADTYTGDTIKYEGGYALLADGYLRHSWKFKPRVGGSDPGHFTNPANACDVPFADNTGTYANISISLPSEGGAVTKSMVLEMPACVVPLTGNADVTVVYAATHSGAGTVTMNVYFSDTTWVEPLTLGDVQTTATETIPVATQPASVTIEIVATNYEVGVKTATVKIYDVRVEATAELDDAGDLQAQQKTLGDIKTLYSGADGLTRNWTTGAVTEIHELHRDLLHRWAGYTTEPTGWSDLDTARSGWLCRWWATEPVELAKALEQAQYEGCFIFTWGPTGVGRYIWVKSSYSSGDVAATIDPDADVRGPIKYSHTPFDDLLTQQEISYERHPADDSRYLSTHTQTNSTARTNWNIQTAENVAEIELDMLVAEVDTHAEYYENIFGDLKTIIQLEVVRPALLVLEIGDIIQLSGSAVYYMVTDERRSPGKLSLTAREVG